MKVFVFILLLIILLPLILKFLVHFFFRVPEEYKQQKKKEKHEKNRQLLEEQSDDIEEELISQFSPETLNDKEKFIETFTLNSKPYENIPEITKKEIFIENAKCLQGLSEEDRMFVAKVLYEHIVELNYNYSFKDLRNFIFEKLKLKYKYLAERILRHQTSKAYIKLHRLELLQNEVKKAKWCYLGETTCDIKKHKYLHGIIFNLEKGFFDEELGKYIFPTDLENCNCTFIATIDKYEDK